MGRWYEIINPSDKVSIRADDDMIAAIATLLLGRGMYGLRTDDDDRVLPVFFGSDPKPWLAEKGLDLDAYIKEHHVAISTCLETAFYGSVSDARALEAASLTLEQRSAYNDAKRSSMNNIGAACFEIAKNLRRHFTEVSDG